MAVETNYSYNAFIIGRSIIIAHVISANFEQMEHNKFDMNVTQFHSIVQHTCIIMSLFSHNNNIMCAMIELLWNVT